MGNAVARPWQQTHGQPVEISYPTPPSLSRASTDQTLPVEKDGERPWRNIPRMESWPKEARPLKQRNCVSYLYLFGDVLLVLLPIVFIGKVIPR
jgi:hypothetical protein